MQTHLPRGSFRPLLAAFLVFVVATAGSAALIFRLERDRLHHERARVFELAGDCASDLQRRLDRAFSATYALAALIRQGDGEITSFGSVAREMLPYYPGVAALELAPGGVIQAVFPLAGNEDALGHDLLVHPARVKEARLAVATGRLTLAGPFDLVQGGVGAAARLPVFLPGEKGKNAFWGFVVALVRFPQVLDGTLLSGTPPRGFAFQLWRIHPDTREKQIIASSGSSLNSPVECPVPLPNGIWTLSLAPVKGWSDPAGLSLKVALGLLFSLLLAWLTRLLFKRDEERLHLARYCIDHAAIGIFRIGEDARIIDINDQYGRALGYSHEELCSMTVFDIDPGLTPALWSGLWDTLVRTRGPETTESRHRRSDGSLFPVEITASYLEHKGEGFSVCFVTDITERKRHEEELKHLATHDELTGLANRALLLQRLEQSLHYAHRSGLLAAVLLLDLDRFKVINDSLGHAFGDRLLCAVARRLGEVVRETDTVARLGGDEFVLILGELGAPEDVRRIAAKILHSVAEPLSIDGREMMVTASLGISIYPTDGDDGATLLRNADMAMYRAKNDRSTFALYSPEMNRRIVETLEMESALRRAVEKGELCLHYQPKVDLESGRMVGCEALVRWRHPKRGTIMPDDFIPLAEETGVIVPLGTWVLKEACRQNRAWQEEGHSLTVAVNLSASQLRKRGLTQIVEEIIREAGLDPGLLELELTESMVMDDPEEAQRALLDLKKLGVRLSLDDFGTGYSSLNYLRRFPVDTLKIDRSFIRDVATDPSVACVVTSVIAIAKSLGLAVIAEGVETNEQLAFLSTSGCDMYQGFLFSRPVSAEELGEMLRGEGRAG